MLSVDEARAAMLAAMRPPAAESVKLIDALGRVLADPVVAARDQPPFASSAMDGYAVRRMDTPGRLRVIGESAAGRSFAGSCEAGTAIRISTGAALPDGADAVVIQEDVRRDGNLVDVPEVRFGNHVRPRAVDFAAGTVLLPPGRKLDGMDLALAAASGASILSVARPPRVAILSSGDELVEPGTDPGPSQIYESNTHGIAGLIRTWGGVPHRLGFAADDAEAIARAAERGLIESDLLVVVGGASVGEHDRARPALMQLGFELSFSKVAVRPGRPTWFGTTSHGPVLGLAGNPASALVCSHIFLRPLIEAMLGRDPRLCVQPQRARLTQALPGNGPREHYLRARLTVDSDGRLTARAFENQDSSILSVFASANALIRLPPDAPAQPEGAVVDVLLLESL